MSNWAITNGSRAFQSQFSNVPFLERSFHAAKVVLSRFHFVCNGSAPLGLDWDSPTTLALARVDPNQAQFMKNSQTLIKTKGEIPVLVVTPL